MIRRLPKASRREVIAPPPTPEEPAAVRRLKKELEYYDASATNKRRLYQSLSAMQLLVGASVPVVAGAGVSATVVATLAAVVVFLQGVERLFQFHTLWLSHRHTYESLKGEEGLYLAGTGYYQDSPEPEKVLAQRVADICGAETSRWVARSMARATLDPAKPPDVYWSASKTDEYATSRAASRGSKRSVPWNATSVWTRGGWDFGPTAQATLARWQRPASRWPMQVAIRLIPG